MARGDGTATRYRLGMHRIFTTSFADVYPLYVAKVERKGRTKAELLSLIHISEPTRPY